MDISKDFEVFVSRGGQRKLFYKGYLYCQKEILPSHKVLWKCFLSNSIGIYCRGRVTSDRDVTNVTSEILEHCHPSDLSDDIVRKLREQKRRNQTLSVYSEAGSCGDSPSQSSNSPISVVGSPSIPSHECSSSDPLEHLHDEDNNNNNSNKLIEHHQRSTDQDHLFQSLFSTILTQPTACSAHDVSTDRHCVIGNTNITTTTTTLTSNNNADNILNDDNDENVYGHDTFLESLLSGTCTNKSDDEDDGNKNTANNNNNTVNNNNNNNTDDQDNYSDIIVLNNTEAGGCEIDIDMQTLVPGQVVVLNHPITSTSSTSTTVSNRDDDFRAALGSSLCATSNNLKIDDSKFDYRNLPRTINDLCETVDTSVLRVSEAIVYQYPSNQNVLTGGETGQHSTTGSLPAGRAMVLNQPLVNNRHNNILRASGPCGVCHSQIRAKRAVRSVVQCEMGCGQWFHRRCVGLTMLALRLLRAQESAVWACDPCLAAGHVPLVITSTLPSEDSMQMPFTRTS